MISLKICIPENNSIEKKYVIDVLLHDFLGLSYEFIASKEFNNYIIKFEDKQIEIQDAFFKFHLEPLSYLKKENIPQKILWLNSRESNNKSIPIIYGNGVVDFDGNKIYCGLDIFASSFFMLTRWEEYVLPNKDEFGRCNENDMFVVKHGIYDRPIVDEYVEFLRDLLFKIGVDIPTVRHKFSVHLTHDIDFLFRYADFTNFLKNLAGDILNRHSFYDFSTTLYNYFLFKIGKKQDPFDTFNEIMDLSDSKGFKSAFYFKASINGEYDCTYNIFDKRVCSIIDKIVKRGHEVGIHPSKNTFNNSEQFKVEVKRLRSLGVMINGGRQHYLLYDLPYTLRTWSENGLKYDAGLGFAFRAGFRCGTSQEFDFFDCLKRETLPIKIQPLICMEGALFDYQKDRSLIDIEKELLGLVDKVYHHSGCFVFLWHNDRFYRPESIKTVPIYKNVLSYLSSLLNASR